LLALSILAGTAIGAWYREPSRGLVLGAAAGVAITILLWLRDRRR